MDFAKAFQAAALKLGFVDMDECGDGTVLWLKRAAIDAPPTTLQRMCIDTVTDSATVYWTNVHGHLEFKTFRRVASFQQWMSNRVLVGPSNHVGPESSRPVALPPVLELSIAAGAGKRAS
jgi:hypothetical protein